MMITSFLFFRFSKKLFKKEHLAFFTTLLMVLLTTLPWLEGHIPNGELFVMGFVMLGANIFSGSSVFENFFRKETKIEKINIKEISTLVFSGILFSLGILTKVPALLDLAGFLVIFWLILAA
jgi:4-amino-4-deoxy-L-arabinose transferase-like glycosyltransferase